MVKLFGAIGSLIMTGSLLMSSTASAVALKAECYQIDADNQEIHGVAVNKRTEIGSVSKIITAYWALNVLGPEYRFNTQIFISNVDDATVDIHIKGSHDPYFGKTKLQVLVANLNKMGIKKIRYLTFDENFEYLSEPESNKVARDFYKTTFPEPNRVLKDLTDSFRHMSKGYAAHAKELNKVYKMDLPKWIAVNVKQIKYVAAAEVTPEFLSVSKMYSFKSTTLVQVIKEVNRNSNNYASNILFESLGGAAEFAKFIKADMGLTEDDLIMLNGSGDHFYETYDNEKKFHYNQATCVAVLKILHSMRKYLKNHGLDLQDALAVVGKDEPSTVNTYYHPQTDDAIVAKTGTVDPSVALAGLASTKNGAILFASVYGPTRSESKAKVGRRKIDAGLLKLVKQNGGSEKIGYESSDFYEVDNASFLDLMNSLSSAKKAAPPPISASKPVMPKLK